LIKKENENSFNSKNKNAPNFLENKDESKTLPQRKSELFGLPSVDNKSKLASLAAGSGSDSSIGGKSKNEDFSGDDKEKKKLAEALDKKKAFEINMKSNTLGELSTKPKNSLQLPGPAKETKQESDENEYDDEQFEENVEEELFEGEDIDEDLFYKQDKNEKKLLTSSEDVIAASQSQGFDISVDSVQLEEYEYYEEAVKVK